MEEKKLRQLFKNRADAYLNTIDESVEQGMSEDCFIKAVNEVFSLHVVVERSEQFICGVKDGFCPYEESDRKCRAEHKCINQETINNN